MDKKIIPPKSSYLSEMKKKNYPLALTLLDKEINADPDNPILLYNFALCCFKTKNYQKAISVLEGIIDKSGRFIERDNIFRLIILCKIYLKEYDGALRLIDDRLRINYGDLKLMSFKAYIYEESKRTEEAILEHRKILKIKPDYKNSLNSLAYLLVYEREYTEVELIEATDCIKKALALNPNNPAYLDSFGVLLREKGLKPQAERAFKKALVQIPGNTTILDHIEELYGNLNE